MADEDRPGEGDDSDPQRLRAQRLREAIERASDPSQPTRPTTPREFTDRAASAAAAKRRRGPEDHQDGA